MLHGQIAEFRLKALSLYILCWSNFGAGVSVKGRREYVRVGKAFVGHPGASLVNAEISSAKGIFFEYKGCSFGLDIPPSVSSAVLNPGYSRPDLSAEKSLSKV